MEQRISERLLSGILAFDLETTRPPKLRLHDAAAAMGDEHISQEDGTRLPEVLARIDRLAGSASFVLGHNLIEHDLAVLRTAQPDSAVLRLPAIDTLLLSPLAHPENPYHALLKDYKLCTASLSNPLLDARAALDVFDAQLAEFARRYSKMQLSVFRTCFHGIGLDDRGGIERVFAALGANLLEQDALARGIVDWVGPRCCATGLTRVLATSREERDPALAYATAWLGVSDGNSVLPAFVLRRFTAVAGILDALRARNCGRSDCAYCQDEFDPREHLQRHFGFDGFRNQPSDASGRGLQQQIVEHGMGGGSHLAILPTGGGKSLCFQLPALVRYRRRGVLTIVISPLQALMRDQVDGLERRTNAPGAATLNSMLTPPERAQVLLGIRRGDVSIVYVSPEQLRNPSFRSAIVTREIGAWVFDEAHCLSKWGHDFRPDYLYAGRFIRELSASQAVQPPPIACVTATARIAVREEILRYFREQVGRELTLFDGGVERDNLAYGVESVSSADKANRVFQLVQDCLTEHPRDSAIVYHATKRRTEQMAEYLRDRGVEARAYHAGLSPPIRRDVQTEFIAGAVRVICATNAFGMGVDKDNVRLVVHADIPGSLENYLQEAGRAGRDGRPAEAKLLFDASDLETQFDFARMSKLSLRDLQQLLRGLRKLGRGRFDAFVISSGELLRDADVNADVEFSDRNAATKVVTAVSWLERAGFLLRDENSTRVFQGVPAVSLEQARQRVAELELPEVVGCAWLDLLESLIRADPDQGLGIDDLAGSSAVQAMARSVASASGSGDRNGGEADVDPRLVSKAVLRAFDDMARAGLIRTGLRLTAFVRHKVAQSSEQRLAALDRLESSLLELLRETAPDADDGAWQSLSLRQLNHALCASHPDLVPEQLRKLLLTLSRDGRGMAGSTASMLLRQRSRELFGVRLLRDWPSLVETSRRRRDVAAVCLRILLERVPREAPASAELLVDFAFEDLTRALAADLQVGHRVHDPVAALECALLYLHDQRVIVLQAGLAVFHPAMTIRLAPESKGRRYTKTDYAPLQDHYEERKLQIHVMDRYARFDYSAAPQRDEFVHAYFNDDSRTFERRYFRGAEHELRRATGRASYDAIVSSLRDPEQQEIVEAPIDENQLVLAGPGSGKSRVVVHRVAWLLRIARVTPDSVLVLCFNRSTARELRGRLLALVGDASRRVTIQTYDGLVMRLLGRSFADLGERADRKALDSAFDSLRREAIALLRGQRDVAGLDADEVREAMLSGYEYVLVDEYQDIDDIQYELISAITGRTDADEERKLGILAVGDDDQNIYEWRGADIGFIRRFRVDYGAVVRHLTTNHRSKPSIVAASTALIVQNSHRMKAGVQLRVSERCSDYGLESPVQRVFVSDQTTESEVIVAEVEASIASRGRKPADHAILARSWNDFDFVRAALESRGIPCRIDRARHLPSLFRVREVRSLLERLSGTDAPRRSIDRPELEALATSKPTDCEWTGYTRSLVATFLEDHSASQFSRVEVVDAISEAIQFDRDRKWFGDGVLLSTAHGVKGREFPCVFALDGQWGTRAGSTLEAERRLYYVAMTRAIESLWLVVRRDLSTPFARSLQGGWIVDREVTTASQPATRLRYEVIEPDGLWLDFAGVRNEPSLHGALASIRAGDAVELRAEGEFVHVLSGDVRIAGLSRKGIAEWRNRLDSIDSARIICMLVRAREDCKEPGRRELLRVESWLLPIIEVAWRP